VDIGGKGPCETLVRSTEFVMESCLGCKLILSWGDWKYKEHLLGGYWGRGGGHKGERSLLKCGE